MTFVYICNGFVNAFYVDYKSLYGSCSFKRRLDRVGYVWLRAGQPGSKLGKARV